jgi:hypothetical protein
MPERRPRPSHRSKRRRERTRRNKPPKSWAEQGYPPVQTLIALSPEDLEAIVARAVRRALNSAADDGLISQAGSPLGSRRHCNAVRRRLASGAHGAAKVGRRYLLTPDALAEELSRTSVATACGGTAERVNDPGAKLRRELGL